MFVSAADQPLNEQETRFALAVVELQVISGGRSEFWGRVETHQSPVSFVINISIGH